jgi:hypothetical protein
MPKAWMHLDGCHFFVWVDEDGRLTFDERQGSDLALHASDEPCDRCTALSRGAKPRHVERQLEALPSDAKGAFLTVCGVVGEIYNGS